jgi:hypothetical protein
LRKAVSVSKLILPYADYEGSGKTTAAKRFETHGYIRHCIALPIKRSVAAIVYDGECDAEHLASLEKIKDTPMDKLGGATPRDMMRKIGIGGRELDEDIWVRMCCNRIRIAEDFQQPVGHVIDDMRWPNEWVFCHSEYDCETCKIIKPTHGVGNEMEGLLREYVPDFTWYAEDGSHDKLHSKVDALAEKLK